MKKLNYAGFWIRFVAYIIDSIVIFVAAAIIIGLLSSPYFFSNVTIRNMTSIQIFARIILAAASWLYFSLFESSKYQGTIGKIILGLKVTDLNGKRISFGRATGRFLAKIISGLILYIGYIMIGFTEKKQGLHDMIASTLVKR